MRLKGEIRERARKKGRKKERETEKRALKRKSSRRRRKYFHKIHGDDAFEGKPMLVLVRWIRRNPKSVLAVCRSGSQTSTRFHPVIKYITSPIDPLREEYCELVFRKLRNYNDTSADEFLAKRLFTFVNAYCNKIIVNSYFQDRIENVMRYLSYLCNMRHKKTYY